MVKQQNAKPLLCVSAIRVSDPYALVQCMAEPAPASVALFAGSFAASNAVVCFHRREADPWNWLVRVRNANLTEPTHRMFALEQIRAWGKTKCCSFIQCILAFNGKLHAEVLTCISD